MKLTATPFTDEQSRAIATRGVSIALSAGAGCGKTFVLTERYLSTLDPRNSTGVAPADLSELVAITFTERAAREMRDRIRLKCFERLQAASAEDAEYWLRLLRALDAARVSTIHSFCTSLLRSHAVEARLDPQFGVLDQSQSQTLQLETIDDCLRRGLTALDEAIVDLMADFDLRGLRSSLQTLMEVRRSIDFDRWQGVTPKDQVLLWEQFHRRRILPLLADKISRSATVETMLEVLHSSQDESEQDCQQDTLLGNHTMVQRREILLELLPNLKGDGQLLDKLQQIVDAARIQGAGNAKLLAQEKWYQPFRDAAKELREAIREIAHDVVFDPSEAVPIAENGLKLLRLTATVAQAYDLQKRKLGVLDFDDLLIHVRRLLADAKHVPLRRRLAKQIRLLMIDEFQDTSPLQVELVKSLCGDQVVTGKLFFVGDFKQSIYRFRGADPDVFRELRDAIPPQGRISLTKNFRSQPAILDFVNALFCDIFAPEYEPLQADHEQVSPEPAIEMMWAVEESAPHERKGSSERIRRREADWIARRLRQLLDSRAPIVRDVAAQTECGANTRAVQPGDIALLLRVLSDVQYYEEALRNYGLDYYLVGGHAFYAQQEIFDVLNLLRTLASPCDQVSLAGVLRSPFFSLADATLYWLSQHDDGLAGGLFDSNLPRQISGQQRRRASFAAGILGELRARKDRMPIANLIDHALARTGYDAILLAEFLGERKLANLRKLMDMARNFERSGMFSLADFIVQLSQFVANQPKEPLAAIHPESTDVIRLMTIHQSKGLEFPVVVVPDMDRKGNRQKARAIFSDDLGPLVKPDDNQPSCGYDMFRIMDLEEEEKERLRLLYVACTRAKDYLILSSGISDLKHPSGLWMKTLANRFDLETGELLGELPEGYHWPKIALTRQQPDVRHSSVRKMRRKNWSKHVRQAMDLGSQGQGRSVHSAQPLAADQSDRRNYSFSRLTSALQKISHEDVHKAPDHCLPGDGVEAARIDPLGLGSLTHDMLEAIPFNQSSDVAQLARRLGPRHFTDPTRAVEEATQLVSRFLTSHRARELAKAQRHYRELEFLLAWPPGKPQEKSVYLEGFIDCLYQDAAGQWQVLDYKTNDVTETGLAQAASEYQMQLYVYALAAERVLGQSPESLILHFLRPGLEYTYDWDENARQCVVDKVNQAIEIIVNNS